MGYIPSEENESEKKGKEITLLDLEEELDDSEDSLTEIGNQIHAVARNMFTPPFTISFSNRSLDWIWHPPKLYHCSICDNFLTSGYPDGYPDKWKICCFCFVAWNEVNKSSQYRWWRVIGKLRARIYYWNRRDRFNRCLELKND